MRAVKKRKLSTEGLDRYEALAATLASGSGVEAGKMFGMPTLKTGGKAFAGFYDGSMTFKLPPTAHARALGLAGARVFDPSGMGRPMKEWVEVPAGAAGEWEALARQSLDYVRSKAS